MYPPDVRRAALVRIRRGASLAEVSRSAGISRAALREWRDRPPRPGDVDCPRCAARPRGPEPAGAYAYLLGQYLGDGCLSRGRGSVWSLRIACADSWPGVMNECVDAITRLRPAHRVSRLQRQGCTAVTARWKHWICLFPQPGPGPKHLRPIVLQPWQQDIVDECTGRFLRGLFHSDGCRITNWTERPVAGRPKRYEYPRYLFSNESTDILDLCATALDRLGIAHTRPRPNTISVARRAAVEALDAFVGPKT